MILQYIILGVIQGITEFFPVSSSGHLVIAQHLMKVSANEVALSVVLHLGTALAMIIFFFKDILNLLRNMRFLFFVILVTVITGIIGISGKGFFESLFGSPRAVGISLVFTGVVLLLTKRVKPTAKNNINLKDAISLGIMQGLAIVPGISRSGMTISTLLFRGIDKETSFRFSFLVAIPVVLGAAFLEARKVEFALSANLRYFAAGFIASFLVGILTLFALRSIIRRAKLHYFGYYCIIMALAILLFIK